MGCCKSTPAKEPLPPQQVVTAPEPGPAAAAPASQTPLAPNEGAVPAAQAPAAPLPFYEDTRDQYRLKDIVFFGSPRRILLQSANGPCPLLAICNVLLLRNQMHISPDARYVSFTELVQEVGSALFELNAGATSGEGGDGGADVRANANACLGILPKLNQGLDVNCKFGGPSQFEYTEELNVFDLLDIGLFHGWVVGQDNPAAHAAIANLSYNQMVEKVIAYQEAQATPDTADPDTLQQGLLITEFMDATASQLSPEGLEALREQLAERRLCVFYRNGHFSTMIKKEGQLYVLCTDHGFAGSHVLWERLDDVSGNTTYCDAGFAVSQAGDAEAHDMAAALAAQEQVYAAELVGVGGGMDPDALLALQLMREEQGGGAAPAMALAQGAADPDALLAMQLMQEDLQAQQAQQAQQQGAN